MTYYLILFIWAGSNGATVTPVPYQTLDACEAAGNTAVTKFATGLTIGRFVCTGDVL